MSTQTPCSQFSVEPAASVVDATAVWHGTTLPVCTACKSVEIVRVLLTNYEKLPFY